MWTRLIAFRSATDGPIATVGGQERVDLTLSYRHRHGAAALTHALSLAHLTDSDQLFPKSVRQNLNTIPLGFGRFLSYLFRMRF